MAYVGKELVQNVKKDFQGNIAKWKQDGQYSDIALKELELNSYLKQREQRLVCFILGIVGKGIVGLDRRISQVVSIVESVYNLTNNSFMPFRCRKKQWLLPNM